MSRVTASRKQRDRRVVRAYHAGATAEAVARRFRLSEAGVRSIIHRRGATLTDEQRAARTAAVLERRWQDEDFRLRHAEAVRRARSARYDCPERHRDRFDLLRVYYPAGEARRMIEAESPA